MDDLKEFLLAVTQRIFSNWTALKLAVEHGMGTKERASELCIYITEVLCMNEDLESNEIAFELEEYMDEYFNTQLLDGSAIQIAEELLKFHRYCLQGNDTIALTEFEALPASQLWLVVRFVHNKHRFVRMQCDSSKDEDTDAGANEKNTNETDEGWVEVKRR